MKKIQDNEGSLKLLKETVEKAVKKARSYSGGKWSAALCVAESGETVVLNDSPMKAASLIKLYIMGAVFEEYDTLSAAEPEIKNFLCDMITVSDNDSANRLVGLLGGGNTDRGKEAVCEYCERNGFKNTSMGRLLLESSPNGENFTSAGDCVKFLSEVFGGEFSHSEDMLNLLKRQKLKSKIPSGVPDGIQTANKTGELEDVQNDAAIVFSKNPYILCVMSENVEEGEAVRSMSEISAVVYDCIEKCRRF